MADVGGRVPKKRGMVCVADPGKCLSCGFQGGRHPDQRDVTELEKMQTSIENSYYSDIMPLFINITR